MICQTLKKGYGLVLGFTSNWREPDSRTKNYELKVRTTFRALTRGTPETPIRSNSFREEAFAASPKKTVNDSTKGYYEDLPLILP